MIRITYDQTHFTVKTTHSICNGMGLTTFTKALIVRYYELLGLSVSKGDIIVCADRPDPEESEDATKIYMSTPPNIIRKEMTMKETVYQIGISKTSSDHILTECFAANKIKIAAKKNHLSFSQYILTQ
ncbi:hypothetical protein NRIC_25400 [Enterococcus florum]|uniref:Uncharacterized protein n=1 Tax=Enterococcus florum TaxID=2480627 RepID=A0A4V0WPQ2_9ENTE|nr:hypothetical protein [Enterococcus florum]GCF94649.1 hypothetical protein NRIC_25400 [Enterococcus florum]